MAGPYYIDKANGADVNDGLSEGNAWETIGQAMNTVAAGETVYVQNGTSYTDNDSNSVGYLDTAGTAIAPITFIGYQTNITDGGIAVLDAGDSIAECIDSGGAGNYYVWKNLQFRQGTSQGVRLTGENGHFFVDCIFDNNGSDGANVGVNNIFIGCTFYGNTGYGLVTSNECAVIGCTFYTNAGGGLSMGEGNIAAYNVFYNNSLASINLNNGDVSWVIHNTIDGDDAANTIGIELNARIGTALLNNIIRDCAVPMAADAAHGELYYSDYNCVYSCAGARANVPTGGSDNTDDPGHTDEGNNDYTLTSGSAQLGAGADKSVYD